MPRLAFNSYMNFADGRILTAKLEMYIFTEDACTIAYCPALDMSGYGKDETEAKNSFEQSFQMYIQYCIAKNTLVKDLQKYGWKIKSIRQKKITSPTTEELIQKNRTLKHILFNGYDYKRSSEQVEIPQMA